MEKKHKIITKHIKKMHKATKQRVVKKQKQMKNHAKLLQEWKAS